MKALNDILAQWKSLNMEAILDFEKFNQYAIVHHSTTIEGSTLTEIETQLLLDEGITPKGKPLAHSLMNVDHLEAIKFVIKAADEKQPLSPALLRAINAKVMRQTGNTYNTPLGTIDASTGAYRKGNVRAGNSYFVNYDKVPHLVEKLCATLSEKMKGTKEAAEQLQLSFDAHFDLVTIHPFYDGNGRTSRLLMNFIQQYFGLPLGIVFKEDRSAYFNALIDSRQQENLAPFREFMARQYIRFLTNEMKEFAAGRQGKTGGFSLVF